MKYWDMDHRLLLGCVAYLSVCAYDVPVLVVSGYVLSSLFCLRLREFV